MFGKIVALSVVSIVGLHIYNVYEHMEFNRRLENKGPRDCYNVPGIRYGSEDIQVVEEHDIAIISSGFVPKFPSNIFGVKLDTMDALKAEPFIVEPASFDMSTFHPHGIYVRKSKDLSYYLYVVNHHNDFECVDVFQVDFQSLKLHHKRRITDPLFRLLNDLVVIDDFKFYATNWMSGRNKLLNFLQGLLMLPVGDVIFYNGINAEVAIKNLFVPNGIDVSSNGRVLYVGLSGSKAIAAYSRETDNSLSFIKQYHVGAVIDNIFFKSDSSELWFAGPYRMIDSVLRVFHVAEPRVPSFAFKYTVDADGTLENLTEVFIDDGRLVSGTASVFKVKNYLLLGTVDETLLACKI